MTLVHFYYDPTTEVDRLFGGALATRWCPRKFALSTEEKQTPRHRDIYRPSLDLYESTDNNLVTATFELPGFTSEAITIDVQESRLTVSGESATSQSSEEGKSRYVVRERQSGKFSRTVQLPTGTKAEDVKAKMENGILTVTFPKTSPEQQAKRIVIQ